MLGGVFFAVKGKSVGRGGIFSPVGGVKLLVRVLSDFGGVWGSPLPSRTFAFILAKRAHNLRR